ncbi:hypothetical protein L2E82_23123 [Cichorium intybus]|uniref:Uncharacterized protein n=1 Tax=Cichorium intybus TaxID=13427 RepID=A0ACB9E040_CICIN|nr:hypothetical protein L2E82_23123 [Cichorium intybus]
MIDGMMTDVSSNGDEDGENEDCEGDHLVDTSSNGRECIVPTYDEEQIDPTTHAEKYTSFTFSGEGNKENGCQDDDSIRDLLVQHPTTGDGDLLSTIRLNTKMDRTTLFFLPFWALLRPLPVWANQNTLYL